MILQDGAADLGGEVRRPLGVVLLQDVAFIGLKARAGGVVRAQGAEVGRRAKGR